MAREPPTVLSRGHEMVSRVLLVKDRVELISVTLGRLTLLTSRNVMLLAQIKSGNETETLLPVEENSKMLETYCRLKLRVVK